MGKGSGGAGESQLTCVQVAKKADGIPACIRTREPQCSAVVRVHGQRAAVQLEEGADDTRGAGEGAGAANLQKRRLRADPICRDVKGGRSKEGRSLFAGGDGM